MKTIIILLCLSFPVQAQEYISFSLEHISSPLIRESGYGLNALFIDYTYRRDTFFISGGLGLHDELKDCPEVCFSEDLLARLRIGFIIEIR